MITFDQAVEIITARQQQIASTASLLVAISGIDGSGKSTMARRVVENYSVKV